MEIKMAPSLLAADFLHLENEIRRAEASGADWLHCDVMDGVYVPNISFGFPVISPIGALTKLPLDVHMMTVCPEKYVDRLAEAGAASVTIHTDHTDGETVRDTLKAIRSAGMRAAAALRPKQPASDLDPYLELIDMALIMTVEPGFGGQKFMRDMMPKVRAVREALNRVNPSCGIQVDGGIGASTVSEAAGAGANIFVVGTASFRAPDMAEALRSFRRTAESSYRG